MKYIVYKITTAEGLEYIGQTQSLPQRLAKHKSLAKRRDTFKDGFKYKILGEFETREEALALEAKLVNKEFLEKSTTLNEREGGNTNSFKGKKRPKHSECLKNKPDKGVGHLNTEDIQAKSKFSRQTRESREKSRIGAQGNTNVRGRKWYNNGVKSFMLYQDDPRVRAERLEKGRIKFK